MLYIFISIDNMYCNVILVRIFINVYVYLYVGDYMYVYVFDYILVN